MKFRRLVAFTVSLLLLAGSPAVGAAVTSNPIRPPSKAVVAEWDFFARINAERRARHIPILQNSKVLTPWVVNWARSMATTDGYGHSDLKKLLGTFNFLGENIAEGGADAGTLHDDFMRSAYHRDNLLNPQFVVMAIGVFCDKHGTMWVVEDFGRPWSRGFPKTVPPSPPAPIARPSADKNTC